MPRTLVWDMPTRVFHWLLAIGFGGAASISMLLDDDGPLFPYHAMIGLTLSLMVGMRVIWGLVGTRYARFGSFAFGPRAVLAYIKSTLLGGGARHIGHNPGSAYAIFAMLLLLAALGVTGFMLGRGNEGVKEIHELCANVMLGVVGIHILGVALHTMRHRENITASMIHGKKAAEPADAIPSARPIFGVVFLAITAAWALGILRNYDPSTRSTTLPLIGAALQLGEAEHEGRDHYEAERDDD
jgi:cytochrome b